MEQILGRVEAVQGASITASLALGDTSEPAAAIRIGALVKVASAGGAIVGTVNAIDWHDGPPLRRSITADLLGELGPEGQFSRGVADYPLPGAAVLAASTA